MSASGAIKEIKEPLMPTIEYLVAFLDMRRDTLLEYEKGEGYEAYHEIVAKAKEKILGHKTLGLINGKGSARFGIFDLVNNHGYVDKQEIESDNKNDTTIRVVYE